MDVKVLIICEDEKRYEMLSRRQFSGADKELAKKREQFFKYDNIDNSVLKLENNYTEECIAKNLETLISICDRLKFKK